MKAIQKRLVGATALAVMTLSGAAVAQMQLEEVVVTAQKRAESAQDVPVALTAISGDAIENMGIGNMGDLTQMSSSLTVQESGNRNESPVSIRGIGTFSYAIGVEPSVSVIIDEVPVATTGQAFANLADVERVEVLRGPQSTLFGKNASAGVINIVTKNPSEEFEGSVEVTGADDDYYRFAGSVSGPISDSVGFRLNAYYDDFGGNIENALGGDDLQATESQGVRAKVRFDASQDLTVTVTADYNELDQTFSASTFREVSPDAQWLKNFGLGVSQDVWFSGIGLKAGEDNFKGASSTTPHSASEDYSVAVKVEYQLGEHSVTSITGWRNWEYVNTTDLDGAADLFGSSWDMSSLYEIDQITQEIRIASPASDTFEYVAGLWYSQSDYDRGFVRKPLIPGTTVAKSDWLAYAGNEALSVFGQGTLKLSEQLNVTAGLRYQMEDVEVQFDNAVNGGAFAGSDDDSVMVGRAAVQYFVNDDVMLYASYARGYKGQAYNTTSSFNQFQADNPVSTEDSDAYEVGIKGDFMDGRLRVNANYFLVNYTGFQAQSGIIDPNTGAVELSLDNVGELETSGVELDVTALLSDNLLLNVGASWTDATIEEFGTAQCYNGQTAAQGCITDPELGSIQDLAGKPLNNSPDLKVVVGLDYGFNVDEKFDGFMRAHYQWQDEVNFSLTQDPLTVLGSYGILNLSAGVESTDGRYTVTAFVNNALDEFYVTALPNLSSLYGATALSQIVPRNAERIMGVRLKYNF
ncbi:TonB-dependent receptor [Aequoribacter sp.]|uniref:TonB-dependent receptor n=4 Tax=Aequoribacter sp. TaxID=2847771 RepID=UPI003C3698D1